MGMSPQKLDLVPLQARSISAIHDYLSYIPRTFDGHSELKYVFRLSASGEAALESSQSL